MFQGNNNKSSQDPIWQPIHFIGVIFVLRSQNRFRIASVSCDLIEYVQ